MKTKTGLGCLPFPTTTNVDIGKQKPLELRERKKKRVCGGLSWTARKQELGIRQHERRALRVNIVPSLLIQGTSF